MQPVIKACAESLLKNEIAGNVSPLRERSAPEEVYWVVKEKQWKSITPWWQKLGSSASTYTLCRPFIYFLGSLQRSDFYYALTNLSLRSLNMQFVLRFFFFVLTRLPNHVLFNLPAFSLTEYFLFFYFLWHLYEIKKPNVLRHYATSAFEVSLKKIKCRISKCSVTCRDSSV